MFTSSTSSRASRSISSSWQRLRIALLGLAAAAIAACGSDSITSQQPSSCADCGAALMTMTDAAGDFLSYTVNVTSLKLTKANGTVVETLPATAQIDFVQLVDLSEVLNAGQVPSGEYVAATLGVDFSGANIVVDDGTGTGVNVTPVDATGAALTHLDLTVDLDNRHHLLIDRSRVGRLAFDLDLAASNTVDLATHKVTVSPVIVATVQPAEDRQVRARGKLVSVDTAGSSYTINVRPFEDASHDSGQLVVHTTTTTRFEINGTVSTGAAGLTQLAALTDNPVTIAFGSIDATDHTFTAQRVLAASSADDLHHDYLSGNVLSRSGNALVVGGVRLGRKDGRHGFQTGRVTVNVGTNTAVTRDGQGTGTMSIADISVGQHIEAFGDYSGSGNSAALDATAGRVRLNYTHLFGKVTATAAGSLTLALQSIDGRDPSRFNFAGTGAATAGDANPASYLVNTGSLATTGLTINSYTRLFGFVTPFGTAPPDFTADTFTDFTDTHAGVALGWGSAGTTTPFSASSATGLTVDLTSGLHGAVQLGGRLIDVTTLTVGLQFVPATSGNLVFAIAHGRTHRVDNFSSFADFQTQLATELNGTTVLYSVAADGSFDSAAGVFTVKRLLVLLGD